MENEPYQLGVNEFDREVLKHITKLAKKTVIRRTLKQFAGAAPELGVATQADIEAETLNFIPEPIALPTAKEKQEFGEPDDTCYVCLGKKVVNKTNSGGVVIGTAPCNSCDGTGINPVEEDPKQGEEGED